MYVKTFASDSLDDALKKIKKELGPDAIILKTVTNKGIKGAFKKNKIEITAAIAEKQYMKKAKVDSVLTPEQKETFYKGKAANISQMIEGYENPVKNPPFDYGNLGLNKVVKSKKGSDLDSFLGRSVKEEAKKEEEVDYGPEPGPSPSPSPSESVFEEKTETGVLEKLAVLEKKILELSQQVRQKEAEQSKGLSQLRSLLATLNLDGGFINKIVRGALFELTDEELPNLEVLMDFTLREMSQSITTKMPRFSQTGALEPVITILLSEVAAGQTSMLYKLGVMKKNSALIIHGKENKVPNWPMALQLFNLEVTHTQNLPEAVSCARKLYEEGKSVFIDFRNDGPALEESKSFVDAMKRSFPAVEVLVCLSAIHSELYNKKILSKYRHLADGSIFSFLDLCLNYSTIFNAHCSTPDVPLVFFGTGNVIPECIEAATPERILSHLFQLKD